MILRSVVALLIAVVLATPLWLSAQPAHACSCLKASVALRTVRSDAIVLGTVRDITNSSNHGTVIPLNYDLTVEVEKYLKGSGPVFITIQSFTLQGSACSPFDPDAVGKEYLLFLVSADEGRFGTSTCAGSAAITERNAEHIDTTIARIRALVPPQSEEPLAEDGDSDTRVWATVGGALGALAFGAGLFALRWRGARR